ncbi:MAG TPA: hypothetical protein VE981_10140 [Planctomycetota bacterium]|nr:hypothetical protein [Planctomycetota bacterium]
MRLAAAALPLLLAACAGYTRDASPKPPPGPAEAKLIVYQSSSFWGSDSFPIFEYVDNDGKLLGFTEVDAYFESLCPPGKHLFLSFGEGSTLIEADLAAGKTYYVHVWSKWGYWSNTPGLVPVTKGSEEATKLDAAWPRLKCVELDPAKGADYAARKADRVKKIQGSYEEGRKSPLYLKPEDGR